MPLGEPHGHVSSSLAPEAQPEQRTPVQPTVLLRLLDAGTGNPLAGILIGDSASSARTTTANGEVELPEDEAQKVWVSFTSTTHGAGRLRQPWERARVTGVAVYRLLACAQVELTVVDEAGHRCSQAVELRRVYLADIALDGVEPLGFRSASASATGHNVLLALPFGTWKALVPDGDGAFEPSVLTVDEPRERFELTRRQPGTNRIAGIAIDQRGQPAQDVAVHVPGAADASCVTDAQGLFSIGRGNLPTTAFQSLDFARDGEGYAPVLAAGPFTWGTLANVVRVERRTRVVLQVQGSDDLRQGWTLRRFPARQVSGAASAPLPEVQQPDADGRIDLAPASAPEDRLLIDLTGSNETSLLFTLGDLKKTIEPGDVEVRHCVIPAETEVKVEAVDADGLPIPAATVSAVISTTGNHAARNGALATAGYRPDHIGWGDPPVKLLTQGSTDRNGGVCLRVRLQPYLFVRAAAAGYAAAACRVDPGISPVRVVLPRTGSLAGAVTSLVVERGRAWIRNVLVFPRGEAIADPVLTSPILRGHYNFGPLPEGEYDIVIHAGPQGGMQQFPMGTVRVRGATEHDLDASGCVRSTVTLQSIRPEAFPMGATLMVEASLRGKWITAAQVPILRRSASAAAVVPAGIYRVWLRRAAANGAGEVYVLADGEFELKPGQSATWDLTFPTAGGGVVLWTADGQPAARQWFRLDSRQIVQTDDLGRLLFEVFPSRVFALHATAIHRGIWEDEGPVVEIQPDRNRDYTLPR